jgi:hypothetical protein
VAHGEVEGRELRVEEKDGRWEIGVWVRKGLKF